jgi:hypothetical protein
MKFLCNDWVILENYNVHPGMNSQQWIIPQHCLKKGINNLVLVPNRTVSPQAIDPESQDPRRLSIWLHSVDYTLK